VVDFAKKKYKREYSILQVDFESEWCG